MDPSDFNATSTLDNDNDDLSTIYYCNYCDTRLHYESTDEQTGKKIFVCLKCGIEYIPANQLVKRSSRFDTPQGPNRELLTAEPDRDRKASSTQYVDRQQNLSPLFRMLAGKGFKWTSYHEH